MSIPNSSIIIYQSETGQPQIDVRFEGETVWLTQDQMATLFDKNRTTITEHINNVFLEGELEKDSVCRNFRRTGTDNKTYEFQLSTICRQLKLTTRDGWLKML